MVGEIDKPKYEDRAFYVPDSCGARVISKTMILVDDIEVI